MQDKMSFEWMSFQPCSTWELFWIVNLKSVLLLTIGEYHYIFNRMYGIFTILFRIWESVAKPTLSQQARQPLSSSVMGLLRVVGHKHNLLIVARLFAKMKCLLSSSLHLTQPCHQINWLTRHAWERENNAKRILPWKCSVEWYSSRERLSVVSVFWG